MGHQDPFWLPDIVVGIKKKKKCGVMAVMMKPGPFVLTFCHWYQNVHIRWISWGWMGLAKGIWGAKRQMWRHKDKWGTIKANVSAKRQMGCQKGIWGTIKANGAP
jgi:hypothetical protein